MELTEKELKVLKQVLGAKEPSESGNGEYTIFVEGDEFTCDCPDFTFRHGSHTIIYKDEEGKVHTQKGCKHILKHLKKTGQLVKALFS